MKSQLADFVSLLYPRTCINCNEGLTSAEKFLCLGCELDLPKWENSANKGELQKKFVFQPKVTSSFAYLNYMKDGMAQKLIQNIKYYGKKDLGIWLGEKFGAWLIENINVEVDTIIPVPLHRSRLRQRGFNQSDIIATGIGNVLSSNLEVSCVRRIKKTQTQTKKLKTERWTSMNTVFQVVEPKLIDGKRVMVVDDVITTGATTGILCDEIAKYDPKEIIIVALAVGK